jgi:hypothetical protein
VAAILLKETAVTRVGSARVGCGNLWEREYPLADGTIATGLSARVSVDGEDSFVGAGSDLVVEGLRYRVLGVDKAPGALGTVSIEAVGD